MDRRQLAASLMLCLGTCALGATVPPTRAAERATVQEILDGRELYIDDARARVRQVARSPQHVRTGNSRGQLAFETGAVGRLNRFSRMKLGSDCFLINRGQILVSGRQNGCTRSARLSVRGTNYVLAVDEQGEVDLAVLEGSVVVEGLRDDEPTGEAPTTVTAGQRLRLSAQGLVLSLIALTPGDYSTILNGPLFRDFRTPLPAYGSLESHIRSAVPGVSLPSVAVPAPAPSLPRFGLPRLF
jgi:hypothetical protein